MNGLQKIQRNSARVVLLAVPVLGVALGACGTGSATTSHHSGGPTQAKVTSHVTHPTPSGHHSSKSGSNKGHKAHTPAPPPPAAPSNSLEALGQPKVSSQCQSEPQFPVFQFASEKAPLYALNANAKGWPPQRKLTTGFNVVGGGNCTTTLIWTLPRSERQWIGDVYLGAADSGGSGVQFEVNGSLVDVNAGGKLLRTVGVMPEGATVSVDLAAAHTFSVVVPGNPAAKMIGPENVVVTHDHLS